MDDIPLLIGVMKRLGLPAVLDSHLGRHAAHKGLSKGWLAVIWLAYILSAGDHRKYTVREWVERHRHTLEGLLERPIRLVDFTDDRLGILLRRLSKPKAWHALEEALWASTVAVYEVEVTSVRLDGTTTCGYHQVQEGGLMQLGHSKDHRPDLAQLKLMAAAAEPSGALLASDVHPGQSGEDPLYTPLIARVRHLLKRSGLLYVGDSKMSALQTRADIVAHADYYLVPLPMKGETAQQAEAWVEAAASEAQPVIEIRRKPEDGKGEELIGCGYERERSLSATVEGRGVAWKERVLVVCSHAFAKIEAQQLEKRLGKAQAELLAVTPAPRKGRHQISEEAALHEAVAAILARHHVEGLLQVNWRREEQQVTRYVHPGRPWPSSPTRIEVHARYVVTGVQRNEAAIAERKKRLGWRFLATNEPAERMGFTDCVLQYRMGWCLERDFHVIKSRPLGIRPLYVRRDDQIIGLTHLLTIGLRVLTHIEMQVRTELRKAGEKLPHLHPGEPRRVTDRPTAQRLLEAFVRAEITLTRYDSIQGEQWQITPMSPVLQRIVACLGLPEELYARLADNPT